MPGEFIFVVCQNGAEAVCKRELAANHPQLKFSFSRPGFLTFKATEANLPERFSLKSTFARTHGWSLGSAKGENGGELIEQVVQQLKEHPAKHLHVWQRDQGLPGSRGFEPTPTILAGEIGAKIVEAAKKANLDLDLNQLAGVDERVFDLTIVEPDQWWMGFHIAGSPAARWPGGVPLLPHAIEEKEVVSRAYYKLFEALLWAGIHVKAGDICAEIGSSPGGACQLLLERNAKVIAIDPAELEPSIAADENLKYIRARGKEVKKRELRNVRWLFVDLNAAPKYTLDTVEEIVTNQHVTKVMGLVLTLKIPEGKLFDEIPTWIQRVKSFGFQYARTRQLAFNRREICLIGVRDKFALRSGKKGSTEKENAKTGNTKKRSKKRAPKKSSAKKPSQRKS